MEPLGDPTPFKDLLPPSLYAQAHEKYLEDQVLKFICSDCFDKQLSDLKTEIIETEGMLTRSRYIEFLNDITWNDVFCEECVSLARKNLTVPEYVAKIEPLLLKEDYWDAYLENCVGCSDEATIVSWDFETLTLEQALVLRNFPDRVPAFCDERMKVREIHYTDMLFKKKYCSACIGHYIKENTHKIVAWNHVARYDGDEFVQKVLWCPSLWCSHCLYTPLFSLDTEYSCNIIELRPNKIRRYV